MHPRSIEPWLKEPDPFRNGQRPSSGFKIVVIPLGTRVLPLITAQQANSIESFFGFPRIQNHRASMLCGACGMFIQDDNTYAFYFKGTTEGASKTILLRYDAQANVTHGVFHTDDDIPLSYFEKMPAQFIKCSHPLLLPLLTVKLASEVSIIELERVRRELRDIEEQTGYGLNDFDPDWTPPRDYRSLVQRLGQSQSWLHLTLSTMGPTRLRAEFIQRKLQHFDKTLPEESQRRLEIYSRMLSERVEFSLSNIEHAIMWEGLKERMQSQQTVLFNLIAQSDNLINVGLARDSKELAVASKQDSTAMKIIAVLTKFFLPGTFMATFFAMPLFDWSKPSIGQVASGYFWIYWAVTGPLTLLIVTGFLTWAFWQNKHAQSLRSRARESVGMETKTGDMGETKKKKDIRKELEAV